jgi:DNA polymerase III delta subunit
VNRPDPFAPLAPLLASARTTPLHPILFLSGDDEWIVAEGARRVTAAFQEAFREGEVSTYEATGEGVKEAVADAATVALFSTNRLVVLEATELFRGKGLTAEEVDALLDEASEATGARDDPRALTRLSRKAHALAGAAGVAVGDDPEDAARRIAGRVKRADRSQELAALLALLPASEEGAETALDRLLDFAARAGASDNVLLVHAVTPDARHRATQGLRRAAHAADLSVPDESARRGRLAALGLERAIDRHVLVEPEVFELLSGRGRLAARPFLSDLDRLIDSAAGPRVTAEEAARQIADESREYGSDFVEFVAARDLGESLRLLAKLLSGASFTAFCPWGGKEDSPSAKKGPRGEAAFFPLLGLLAAEIRRMLALRAALDERATPSSSSTAARRVDYRGFVDRVLPALKAARPGLPLLPLDAHPFVLHKAYLAALGWTAEDLKRALVGLEAIDRGVKSGAGTGPELLEAWLLSRLPVAPARALAGSGAG